MPIFVRAADEADAAAIGEVHAEAWGRAFVDVFDPASLAAAVQKRRGTGLRLTTRAPARSTVLVVEKAGRVVGFAHCGPEPELHALYVHPDHWGTGAAVALWEAAVAALPAGSGVLWTLAGAGRARKFYENQGWVASGREDEHDFDTGGPSVRIVEYRGPTRAGPGPGL